MFTVPDILSGKEQPSENINFFSFVRKNEYIIYNKGKLFSKTRFKLKSPII